MDARDARPPVWVGHVSLKSPDVIATRDFLIQLGMRQIADGENCHLPHR